MDQPIVVGLDTSPESLAAAEWACQEARLRGLPVELVQAWTHRALLRPGANRAEAERKLSEALRRAELEVTAQHEGVEVSAAQVPGDPAEVLAAAARHAELLVLGSRGLGTVTGFLLGSTSQALLAHASCPVVLIRADWDAPAAVADASGTVAPPSARRGVVLGLDIGQPCDELLAFAFRAAEVRDVPLRVVHVRRPTELFGYAAAPLSASLDRELDAEELQTVREAVQPWRRKYPLVQVGLEVVTGSPARGLVEAVPPAELLVVGRRVRHAGFGFHVGPVTHAAVHHTRCPVAVVPFP